MLGKRKRIVDKTLIEMVKGMPCVACGKKPVDAHHVTTRGAGGHDIPENLMPLCLVHHTAWHKEGIFRMLYKFPSITDWLVKMNRFDVLERVKRGDHGK